MKNRIFTLFACLTIIGFSFAQAPESFKYQSVIRDASGNIQANQPVGLQIVIEQGSFGGTAVYTETFTTTTNSYGLVNLEIGTGTTSDDLSLVDWSNGPYFVEISLDITGGTSYSVMGTSELLSVPYALYAKSAETVANDMVDDADADPTNEIQDLQLSGNTLTITNNGSATMIDLSVYLDNTDTQLTETEVDAYVANNGYLTSEVDGSITNEIQDLNLNGNILTITNNGSATNIDLSMYLDNTDTQLTESEVDAFVANNGYLTTEVDGSITNEIELPTGGSNGQVLQTDGSGNYSWVNQTVDTDTDTQLSEAQVDTYVANNGYLTSEVDGSVTNEIQVLSINYDTIFLSNGGYVKLPAGVKEINDLLDGISDGSSTYLGTDAGIASNLSDNRNVGVGTSSLLSVAGGSYNVAVGYQSLKSLLNTSYNTAVGYQALWGSTGGNQNTAIGSNALTYNTTGGGNTAVGVSSLRNCSTGASNTSVGTGSMYYNVGGGSNVAMGMNSLQSNTGGSNNVAIGTLALFNNTTGNSNTAVGKSAFNAGTAYSNSTALGFNTVINASNQVHLGNASVTEISGQVNFSTYSDRRVKDNVQENVVGIEFIKNLRPVTYNFNVDRENEILGVTESSNHDEKYDIEKIQFSGFIAQEVEEAASQSGYDFSGVIVPENKGDLYKVSYAEFVVPLVKATQEQQVIIEDQQSQIEDLTKRLEALEAKSNQNK